MKKIKIYTKTGDKGKTSLCGGQRVPKNSLRVHAYGCIDELNSFVGMCVVHALELDIKRHLIEIQQHLHTIGSNLSYPGNLDQSSINGESIAAKIPRVTDEMIQKIEHWIDVYDEELPMLRNFILCGGNVPSAALHVARTVCRRAEREVIALKEVEEVDATIVHYLNRLSDYFMVAARLSSKRDGKEDIKWIPDTTTLQTFMEDEE